MIKIILFHSRPTKFGPLSMRTESPLVELTGRSGFRDKEEWKEVRWFKERYSLLDIIFNRPPKLEAIIEWFPSSNILVVEDDDEDEFDELEPVCKECGLGDEVATMQCHGFDYFCGRCNHGWNEKEDDDE